jgi:hypothetical protein
MDAFGDETRRRQLLGNDYDFVITALSGDSRQSTVKSSAKRTSAGSAALKFSVTDGQRKRPFPAIGGPSISSDQARKRARQSVDVIDLTTPSPQKR